VANDYDHDGTPITIISGEVADQAMLHGLLTRVRDLGLPLLAVYRTEANEQNRAKSQPQDRDNNVG
jgi:hypothetical protein